MESVLERICGFSFLTAYSNKLHRFCHGMDVSSHKDEDLFQDLMVLDDRKLILDFAFAFLFRAGRNYFSDYIRIKFENQD